MQHRHVSRSRRWTSLLLAVAMCLSLVPGAASAAPVLVEAPGSYSVSNFADLQAGLADASMTTITLSEDITSTAQLHVTRAVTIDGAGHRLAVGTTLPTANGSKHAISFEASQSPALVKNLTIDSAGRAHGVNTYNNAVVTFENVTLKNSRGAGLTVNGSTAAATNLNTSGNAWGAVNVDPGSGVNTPSVFTLVSGALAETKKIWSDGSHVTPVATVTVNAPSTYVECIILGVRCWAPAVNVSATAGAHGAVSPAVQNVDPGAAATTVTITPDTGYYCSELLIDDVATAPTGAYKIANVGLTSHTVKASFAPLTPFETFDFSPVLASTKTNGAWYTDRYAPAGFAKSASDGDKRLKLSLSSADALANRPSNYQSTFYNTQGRNFDLPYLSNFAAADLFIGSDWDTQDRRADFWANGVDAGGAIVGYPIIGFLKGTGFRVWDNLGWHVVGFPAGFEYGKWYSLRMQFNPGSVTYYVDDQLVYVSNSVDDVDMADCVGFDNVKLQAYNFGESYDVYFDNVAPMPSTPAPFTVATSAGANGSVSPMNPGVDAGDDITVAVTPDTGYHIADVVVDGGSVGASSSVVFSDVDANHEVSVTFAINSYTLTGSAGSAGWITPEGVASKTYGSDATYVFTPFPGYHVADVLVDGFSVGAVASYTFNDVAADHAIAVTFAQNTYMVASAVGANGSATWSGSRWVAEASNLTVFFTPDEGCRVEDVKVDGVSQGAISSYVFANIYAHHTIAVTFAKRTYVVAVAAGANGAISPSTQTVDYGSDSVFAITPAKGYHVSAVLVNGNPVGAVTSYAFQNVTANQTISAVFTANPGVSLTKPKAPTYASKNSYFTAYGYLQPKHTSGTYPVRIYKWKKTSSGTWKSYGYVKAKASNYLSYTKYAGSLRLSSKGVWQLRAYSPADSKHSATWSTRSDYVTVK